MTSGGGLNTGLAFLQENGWLQLQELGPVFANLGKGNRPVGLSADLVGTGS